MVGKLTYGKRQWESLDSQMRKVIPPLHAAMEELLKVVDNDTNAFSEYMAAMKLPKSTADEQTARDAAMQAGLKIAVGVPLQLVRRQTHCGQACLSLPDVEISTASRTFRLQLDAWRQLCMELGTMSTSTLLISRTLSSRQKWQEQPNLRQSWQST